MINIAKDVYLMLKSSVKLVAILTVGTTTLVSPAQAALLSQEVAQHNLKDKPTQLIANRNQSKRFCWRQYGRIQCKEEVTHRKYRWSKQQSRNRHQWQKEQRRRLQDRGEDRNRRKHDRNGQNHRRADEDWREGDRRGDDQDKFYRRLNRR